MNTGVNVLYEKCRSAQSDHFKPSVVKLKSFVQISDRYININAYFT